MDPRAGVAWAFAAVPRADFLPEGERGQAGLDEPVPIGYGQTSSQPSTVRAMLELLDVRPGQRVLDVGAGSGWTTALLARLTGPTGAVVGVERVPELAAAASAAVASADLTWAHVHTAEPHVLGAPDAGPYDRILVSAMARRLPLELVSQLVPGGVMVLPVHGRMLRVVRRPPPDDDPADAQVSEHGWYRFVPLVTG